MLGHEAQMDSEPAPTAQPRGASGMRESRVLEDLFHDGVDIVVGREKGGSSSVGLSLEETALRPHQGPPSCFSVDSSSVHVLRNPAMAKSINQVVLILVWPESGLPWRALHSPEFLGLNRFPTCPLPLICDLSPLQPT